MAVANTLAFHSTATVTAVKYLIVQALGQMYASFYGRNVLIFAVMSLASVSSLVFCL